MYIVAPTLAAVERHARTIARRSSRYRQRREQRDLAQRHLFDARRWHSGYGGPPFGTFAAARLRWWRRLEAELDAAVDHDVVLTRRQLSDLIHLAGRAHPDR